MYRFGASRYVARRALATVMAISLSAAPLVAGSSTASAAKSNGFSYDVVNGGAVITGCANTTIPACPRNITIPAALGTQTVTGIGDAAFQGKQLESVTFSATSRIKQIGRDAFMNNLLAEVEIPASVTTIGATAFASNSNLTQLTFREGSQLTGIGLGAFYEASLTDLSLPDGVSSIGDAAFEGNKLAKVSFAPDAKLETIGKFAYAENQLTSIRIPARVTNIDESAFSENNLWSLTFSPDSDLVEIGPGSFAYNGLQSVSIPVSVTNLGSQAFRGNTKLAAVKFLGGRPTGIGSNSFQDTGSESIYVPQAAAPSWTGTQTLSGRHVVLTPSPVILSQPKGVTLLPGHSVALAVGIDKTIPEQGDLRYQWFKGGSAITGATASTLVANAVGEYKVRVTSWAGSTTSSTSQVVAPIPKPVVKKKQSAKMKVASKLKRNKTYKLPARTAQGVKITWKVKGAGKCLVNTKKHTIRCRTASGTKYLQLTGTAKANSKLSSYKITINRRVR